MNNELRPTVFGCNFFPLKAYALARWNGQHWVCPGKSYFHQKTQRRGFVRGCLFVETLPSLSPSSQGIYILAFEDSFPWGRVYPLQRPLCVISLSTTCCVLFWCKLSSSGMNGLFMSRVLIWMECTSSWTVNVDLRKHFYNVRGTRTSPWMYVKIKKCFSCLNWKIRRCANCRILLIFDRVSIKRLLVIKFHKCIHMCIYFKDECISSFFSYASGLTGRCCQCLVVHRHDVRNCPSTFVINDCLSCKTKSRREVLRPREGARSRSRPRRLPRGGRLQWVHQTVSLIDNLFFFLYRFPI